MGWSVGYRVPPESDLIDEVLLATGKALFLANRFEANCSYVLRVANLSEIVQSDPLLSLEEALSRLPSDHMLGRTLHDLSSRVDLSLTRDKLTVLTQARLARNYIAHEGAAALGVLHSYKVQAMLDALRVLRSKVKDLAQGDNLVSRWVFEIEQPREPIPMFVDSYLALVDDWVFGHMPQNWLDINWQCDHGSPGTLMEHIKAVTSYKPWYSWADECLHDSDKASRRRAQIERDTIAQRLKP